MKRTVQTLIRQARIHIFRTGLLITLLAAAGNHVLADEDININNGSGSGTGWSFSNSTLTITTGGIYTITGSGQTANRIKVNTGITADITLRDVNINVSGTSNACAFDMTGATVNLTLEGDNTLKSGANKAGLQVPDGAAVNIYGAGKLSAAGGSRSAGIGGPVSTKGGAITIHSGTVVANGGINTGGAGIGGGGANDRYTAAGGPGDITINGGDMDATGGGGAPGIGGGAGTNESGAGHSGGYGGTITVNGGTVVARANGDVAGIGVAGYVSSENALTTHLIVNDGKVTAISTVHNAIGGAYGSGGIRFTMNGGTVVADGYFRGIGSGYSVGSSGETVINGGTLVASHSHNQGSGIGGNITVNGGSVKATSLSAQPRNSEGQIVYRNTLTIGSVGDDVSVTAGSIGGVSCSEIPDAATGVYGIKGVKTGAASEVYFWLTPTGAQPVELTTENGKTYSKSYVRSASNNNAETLDPVPYGITLSNAVIPAASYGYGAQQPLNVVVTNAGYNPTGDLNVALSGTDFDKFTLSGNLISSIAVDGTDNFTITITPVTGLAPGTCTAILTVSGGNGITASSDVSFTVNKAIPAVTDLAFDLTPVPYDGSPRSLTVTAGTGITGLGDNITVYYDGDPAAPTGAGPYPVTVDIEEGLNYAAVNGLSLGGNFVIDQIDPTDAELSFTLTPVTYDGKPHPLTVTVDPGITGLGKITAIKYNGSATVPTAAGTYAVTVDISAGTAYAAIFNLPVGSFTIDPAEPTLDVLDFELGDIPCSGTPYPVTVTVLKDIEGLGEIIAIKYNGSAVVPVDPGEYTVTVDLAAGANYAAVTGLPLGTFIILEPPVPLPDRYSVQLPSVEGLTTDPPAGTYTVNSGSNFTFTLTPDVPPADGTPPQVLTNRTTPNRPNASGIRLTPHADGSYTVVIIGIRQNINVTLAVAGDSKSGPTGNGAPAGDALNVYTAPGAIVVANSRPVAAALYVYSLAGTLVRLAKVAPGTARLSVPPGIYIVTDGGAFRRKTVVTR
ncbi:MAG: MBG domain-containing protein [Tannerella sp.]|jgi:hypothetical protein|nr:MBG domain-containing protein [Tannerella sp.]